MPTNQQIEQLATEFNGRLAISALNLQTGKRFQYQAKEVFPTASVVKLPVLLTMMQQIEDGLYTLDDPLMLRHADKIGGSGILQHLTPGLVMPIRDWAFLMMNISDNLATNVLIDQVGLKNVQTWLAENKFPDVQIHRKIDFGALSKDLKDLGTATPDGLTRMITAIFRRQLVSPEACTEMLRMMDGVGSERIGRYLPFSPFDLDVPKAEKLRLAGKTGSLKGMRAQTAVVWKGKWQDASGFAITVMTEGDPAPEMWSADAAGTLVIGRIAQTIYNEVFSE